MSEPTTSAAKESDGGLFGCFGKKDKDKPESKKPRYTRITQQELGACKPVLTKTAVTLVFIVVAVIFIPIGAVCLAYGMQAKEVTYRYDDVCIPSGADGQRYLWQNVNNSAALTCNLQVKLDKDLKGDVYMYYELRGFYQNHRRYVRSHIDLQMAGKGGWESTVDSDTQAQSCVPWINYPPTGVQINPCGLVAWSYFNDSYSLTRIPRGQAPQPLSIKADGIAFGADVDYRFADYLPTSFNPSLNQYRGGGQIQGTLKQDQRFMVWMRLSHLPRFRKLWGILSDQDLREGDMLNITILNQYNTYSFSGTKHLVLSTTTWLGGSSIFLGVAYLVTGGLSLVCALIYLVVVMVKPRPFADTSRLRPKPVSSGA